MNTLVSKINLKQKFIIIFCIVVLFTVYEIVSDTINQYYIEERTYNKQSKHLKFAQAINQFIINVQKDKIETNIYLHNKQTYKLIVIRKSENLKQMLTQIINNHKNHEGINEELHMVLKEFDYIIQNIHMLTQEDIVYKYQIISHKLLFISNINSNFAVSRKIQSNTILQIVLKHNPFVLYNLSHIENINMQNQLIKNGFNSIILQTMDNTHKQLKSIHIESRLLKQFHQTILQLKEFDFKQSNHQNLYPLLIQTIEVYEKINKKLFQLIQEDMEQLKEQQKVAFNINLSVELIAFAISIILLIYFYRSLFMYIRKMQNAHKVKSIFLSNMSHELRTPLNAIIGFLDILKESKDKQERKKFIDIIYKSSKQLLYIINDILDFSKIEDAKLKIEKKPFNIVCEFNLLIELFSANAASKNISLKTQFDKNVPECIISDKFRIKQIISNLLSNAIKFTPEGGVVKLIIKVQEQKLNIAVEDNGIGIDKKAQKNIFKSFLQAKDSTSRQYGGTGLGLSISSKLVSLLGSKLHVQSKEYFGSKFYFNLKIKECKKNQQKNEVDPSLKTYQGKVLLVEDNPTNQFLMQITFSNLKLEVVVANDGLEAIEKFKDNNFDIIFMDDNMPNKSGVEATKEIIDYEQEHHLNHTPIVALTANTSSEIKKKLFKSGMDEYMAKPFDIKLLHQILQKYLS